MAIVAAQRGKIILTPKAIVDRHIAESVAGFNAGRARGPFKTASAAIASMRKDLRTREAGRRS